MKTRVGLLTLKDDDATLDGEAPAVLAKCDCGLYRAFHRSHWGQRFYCGDPLRHGGKIPKVPRQERTPRPVGAPLDADTLALLLAHYRGRTARELGDLLGIDATRVRFFAAGRKASEAARADLREKLLALPPPPPPLSFRARCRRAKEQQGIRFGTVNGAPVGDRP